MRRRKARSLSVGDLSPEDAHIVNKIYMLIHLAFRLSLSFHFPLPSLPVFPQSAPESANRSPPLSLNSKFLLLICRMRHFLCAREVQTYTRAGRRCAEGGTCEYHVSLCRKQEKHKNTAATSLKIASNFSFRFNLKILINEIFCWCSGRSSAAVAISRLRQSLSCSLKCLRLFTSSSRSIVMLDLNIPPVRLANPKDLNLRLSELALFQFDSNPQAFPLIDFPH